MTKQEILSRVDHTMLAATATLEQIKKLCDDAVLYSCASVCIPPSYVKEIRSHVGDRIKICTVIGFPNGYCTTRVKCFEARDAVENTADEIDMVIDIGMLKNKDYKGLLSQINCIKEHCGERILKVIVETCLLSEEEKIRICSIVSDSNADFIKTSTGFANGGATREDIALFKANVRPTLKIKAAGGISSFKDAEDMIRLGADRLGTSRLVNLMKNENRF